MIFRSVPKPAVHLRRKPRAASRRFLGVAVHRKQPPNAVDRHAVVVRLWWDSAKLEKGTNPRLFATPCASGQPTLFALGALG